MGGTLIALPMPSGYGLECTNWVLQACGGGAVYPVAICLNLVCFGCKAHPRMPLIKGFPLICRSLHLDKSSPP